MSDAEECYPPVLIREYDPLPSIYSRQYVHKQLALAAQCDDARAWYHLYNVFQQFCGDSVLTNQILKKVESLKNKDVLIQSFLEDDHKVREFSFLSSYISRKKKKY